MVNLTNSYALAGKTSPEYANLKLLQPLSKQVSEGKSDSGKFFNTETEESYESLDVIIFGVREEFRVWNQTKGLPKFPEYFSDDMKSLVHLNPETGQKLGEEPLLESSQWKTRKENKNARTQYCFLLSRVENAQLLLFRISGLGYKYAKQFLNRAKASGRQLFEFVTNIKVTKETTAYGSTYVPDFHIIDKPLSFEWDIEEAAKVTQKFVADTLALLPAG